MPLSSQRIDFVNESPRTIRSSISGRTSSRGLPGRSIPRKPSRVTRSSTATPCFLAKPAAAFSASSCGGPFTHSSGVCSLTSWIRAARRRGVTKTCSGRRPSSRSTSTGSCSVASRQAPAGSSSQPISSSSVAIALQVELRHLARERPNAPDVRGALRHGERPARVEQVERVGALQYLVVGRQRQTPREQLAALLLVLGEASREHVHGGDLEVVRRPLSLAL